MAQKNAPTVLIYSDNSLVRAAVVGSITPTPAADVATIIVKEFATAAALKDYFDDKGSADLLIVDAEAAPVGGLGLAREIKDEVYNAPPIIAIIAREADRWLATWARVEAIVLHPVDPRALATQAASLLRKSAAVAAATAATAASNPH